MPNQFSHSASCQTVPDHALALTSSVQDSDEKDRADFRAREAVLQEKPLIQPGTRASSHLVTSGSVLRCGAFDERPDLVIAIPVCNERDRIVACVGALALTLSRQPRAGVVLLVNNSSDGSAEIAHLTLKRHGLTGVVVDATLDRSIATAGWARRLALDTAANWARPGAALMTTDADGCVAADWAEANLTLLNEGANLVCGRIAPDANDATLMPRSSARSDAIENEYTALSTELDARLDPRAHDPWPHHGLASGASLAMWARDYRAVGRLPPLPCSEDRAFAALVERHDLRVRHSDVPLVTVSCRMQGRAKGGMADAIAARIADPDSWADQRLLPAAITARRARFRRALRAAWAGQGGVESLMSELGVPAAQRARARQSRTFGALWAEVEAGAGTLAAARMRPSDLAQELSELRRSVDEARSRA